MGIAVGDVIESALENRTLLVLKYQILSVQSSWIL